MSTIVTRTGKGSTLTWIEADANFTNLNTDKAELASPTFTGTPTAPTPAVNDNDTSIATTAFVRNEFANGFGGGGFSFKNKLINGDMRLAQRGSAFINPAASYTLDRWIGTFTGGTVSALIHPTTFESYLALTGVTTVGHILQRIENVNTLAGKTVTLSFRIAVNAPIDLIVYLGQNFGSGGSAEVDGIGLTVVPVTTTLTRYSVTIAIPSIAGKTVGVGNYLKVDFSFPTGFSAADLYDVQLEEGSVATPFEQRPIGLELSLCQRYYEIGNFNTSYMPRNDGSYLIAMMAPVTFKVTKRVIPTIVDILGLKVYVSGTPESYVGGLSVTGMFESGFSAYLSSTMANTDGLSEGTWAASAEL